MCARAITLRRLRREQSGFMLNELVLVLTISIVVIGLPLTLVLTAFKNENDTASRSATAARAQIGVDKLVRDLRQATKVTITAPATAVVEIPTPRATPTSPELPATTVTWTCTVGAQCTRQAGTGPAVQLIPGVLAATLTPTFRAGAVTPHRVDILLQTSVLNERKRLSEATAQVPLTFRNGVDLRNLG